MIFKNLLIYAYTFNTYINVYNFRREMTVIKKSSFIKAILVSIIIIQTKLQLFASILAYILAGNYMKAQKVSYNITNKFYFVLLF